MSKFCYGVNVKCSARKQGWVQPASRFLFLSHTLLNFGIWTLGQQCLHLINENTHIASFNMALPFFNPTQVQKNVISLIKGEVWFVQENVFCVFCESCALQPRLKSANSILTKELSKSTLLAGSQSTLEKRPPKRRDILLNPVPLTSPHELSLRWPYFCIQLQPSFECNTPAYSSSSLL